MLQQRAQHDTTRYDNHDTPTTRHTSDANDINNSHPLPNQNNASDDVEVFLAAPSEAGHA